MDPRSNRRHKEVSELIAANGIDGRGPVGLLVTKVIDHCTAPVRDFDQEELIKRYQASQRPCSPDDPNIRRHPDHVRQSIRCCRGIFDREWNDCRGDAQMVVRAVKGRTSALTCWCLLRERSVQPSDEIYEEATGVWLWMNDELQDVYRAEFKAGDLGPLAQVADELRRKLGIEGHAERLSGFTANDTVCRGVGGRKRRGRCAEMQRRTQVSNGDLSGWIVTVLPRRSSEDEAAGVFMGVRW
jgi:hypothetical protein